VSVLHNFCCSVSGCPNLFFDHWTDSPPSCPDHPDAPTEITYLPKHYRPFNSFTYEEDGTGRQIQISSLQQLREIESRSIKEWEGGSGRPVIFREFTQDRSNRDANVFQKLKQQVDRRDLVTRNSRGEKFITSRTGPVIAAPEED
jgi:hypothetical protein